MSKYFSGLVSSVWLFLNVFCNWLYCIIGWLRNDLKLYCPKQLGSDFIEVLLSYRTSQIIGTICEHPSMNVSTFTKDHLKIMLNLIHHENESASPGIYPSSFNNVRFWKKIDFLNVVNCRCEVSICCQLCKGFKAGPW